MQNMVELGQREDLLLAVRQRVDAAPGGDPSLESVKNVLDGLQDHAQGDAAIPPLPTQPAPK